MSEASSSTSPSTFGNPPVPTLWSLRWSSTIFAAATTASKALPPRRSTRIPVGRPTAPFPDATMTGGTRGRLTPCPTRRRGRSLWRQETRVVAHPVVEQLRFTRSEWLRGLNGVSGEDASRHCGQMNSIGWIVGHLTWQEQRYLLHRPQGIMLRPEIQAEFVSGGPMSTPSLRDMLAAWRKVTATTEDFLDRLTTQALLVDLPLDGKRTGQSQGS